MVYIVNSVNTIIIVITITVGICKSARVSCSVKEDRILKLAVGD